jgi:DNA helicase HerA-like ATPase
MSEVKNISTVMAHHLYENYISKLADTQKIIIDEIDYNFSKELAYLCNTEHNPKLDFKCNVVVLAKEVRESTFEVSSQKAVEYRNQKAPMLIFIPTEFNELSSLNDLKKLHTIDLINTLTSEYIEKNKKLGMPNLAMPIRRGITKLVGPDELLSFLIDINSSTNPLEYFAENLARIGLIPDVASNVTKSGEIERNLMYATQLSRRNSPLIDSGELVGRIGLPDSDVKLRIKSALDTEAENNSPWIQSFNPNLEDSMLFANWPLVTLLSANIIDLRFKSFLAADGGVSKKSKLGIHVKTNEFVCTGKIVLDWIVDPLRLPAEVSWRLEILNSVNMDVAEAVVDIKLKNSSKSRAIDLTEFLEDNQQRMVARISAVDDSGAILTMEDGEPASALSEDFLLIQEMDTEVDGGDQKSTNVDSIAEALVLSFVNDKSIASVELDGASREHHASQTFEFEIGSRLARMRVSRFIRQAQMVAMSNSSEAMYFSQKVSLGASVIDARSLVANKIEISNEFKVAREKYLSLLFNNGEPKFPETLFWDKESIETLNAYLSQYIIELDKSDSDKKREILSLDTVTVSVETSEGPVIGTILLPIHPMRSKWISQHYEYLQSVALELNDVPFAKRRNSIDLQLISKLEPTNLPFALEVNSEKRIYATEFLYGSAIYLSSEVEDVANQISIISSAIGITRELASGDDASKKIAEHLGRYRDANRALPGLKVSVVNPGDGSLLADGLDIFEKSQVTDERPIEKLDITCYSTSYSFADPVGALVDLQRSKLSNLNIKEALFNSNFSLKALTFEDFDRKPEFSHVSVMQSATQLKTDNSGINFPVRKSLLGGLITYLHSDTIETPEGVVFKTSVSTGNSVNDNLLETAHRQVLQLLSNSPASFQMSIVMNRDMAELVNEVHRRSDWVLTIDRFIGLNLYEEMLAKNNPSIVVLDYSPDFVDGFGERITLTTTKNNEVSKVISRAMRDLGLADEGMSSLDVLRDLAKISGRLAMRLVSQNSLATEAVGLCATVRHLRDNERLANTIIIPVDAHPELFGLNRHDPDATSKRCDLMLVKLAEDAYSIQLIEVKTRKGADVEDLIPVMRNQLQNTEALLNKVIFNGKDGRVDSDLQWARWSSLLHFYLDRSRLHGNFQAGEDIAQMHTFIESLCERQIAPSISKSGYIVSLNAEAHNIYDENDAYQLHVLNEEMLASSGWTTIKENEFRQTEQISEVVVEEESEIEKIETRSELPKESTQEIVSDEAVDSSDQISAEDVSNGHDDAPSELFINLGESASTTNFNWKISLQGSPHGVIVGIPGQGKSVTTRNILNQFAENSLPSIVFDFHGEMSEKVSYDTNSINVADEGLPFSPFEFDAGAALPIKSASQEIAEILAAIGNLGEIQRSNVNLAIRDCYAQLGWSDDGKAGSKLPSISNFEGSLRAVEAQNKGKNAIARLQSFTDFGLFRDDNQNKFDVLNPNGFIFNVSKYRQDEVKITAGAFILRKIYNEMFLWGNAQKPKLAIVLDEAHRLSKDPTIPKLMKEGRKYGIVVLLVSQSLDDFAPQVIENAGTKIAFRTNYPASRKVASLLQNKNSKDLADRLEVLTTGKAIVSTPENPKPALVKMTNAD